MTATNLTPGLEFDILNGKTVKVEGIDYESAKIVSYNKRFVTVELYFGKGYSENTAFSRKTGKQRGGSLKIDVESLLCLDSEYAISKLDHAIKTHNKEMILFLLDPDSRPLLPDWDDEPDYLFEQWDGLISTALTEFE